MTTPPHGASENGHTNVMKLLIDHRADVNARGNNGWTPLHYTSYRGHTNAMKLLESYGAIE